MVCHTDNHMMRSSNGNIFRVTGPLCREFIGQRWIPHKKASDAELWCVFFDLRLSKRLVKQSRRWLFETPSHSIWHRCGDTAILKSVWIRKHVFELNGKQDMYLSVPFHCAVARVGYGPLTRFVKLRVAHAPGMPGTFSPPPTSMEIAK